MVKLWSPLLQDTIAINVATFNSILDNHITYLLMASNHDSNVLSAAHEYFASEYQLMGSCNS